MLKRIQRKVLITLKLFRRSLLVQIKEFFRNSSLHGVKYFAERNRSNAEKFLWFCFISVGSVIALIIIFTLWEKFQKNATITGLDTDYHVQNVIFPTVIVCPEIPFSHDKAVQISKDIFGNSSDFVGILTTFLEIVTTLSYSTAGDTYTIAPTLTDFNSKYNLRESVFQVLADCEDIFENCKYRDEEIECCAHFELVLSEYGACHGFNSRFKSTPDNDLKVQELHDLYETDNKWSLYFQPIGTAKIYIISNEEYFGMDFKQKFEWNPGQLIQMRLAKKTTYTTEEARQLTIAQRRCIFADEVQLKYFTDEYTYSGCMKECRIDKALKLCHCNPSFNIPLPHIRMCDRNDLPCLDTNKEHITNIQDCLHCELSCSKTDFNIEKILKEYGVDNNAGVLIELVAWPIQRYKREVIFGWVDLLVSFGGIASFFLGFSLLSGIEIIYYFTLRACCMLHRNKQQLKEVEESIQQKPPPLIDLSLGLVKKRNTPFVEEKEDKAIVNNVLMNIPMKSAKVKQKNKQIYKKHLIKSPKVFPQFALNNDDNNWLYGDYLP